MLEMWTQPMDVYSGLEPSLQFEARVNKTTKIRALFSDQFCPAYRSAVDRLHPRPHCAAAIR
jgi:hypothetical protein